jgi:hypothetical protein
MEETVRTLLLTATVVVLLAGDQLGTCADSSTETAVKPLISWHGQFTSFGKRISLRITSDQEWRALWLEHKTGSRKPQPKEDEDLDCPELDFSKVMVIALIGGGPASWGYTVDSIIEDEERITVRVESGGYQLLSGTFLSVEDAFGPKEDSTHSRQRRDSWGIFVLPHSNKEIKLQSRIMATKDSPPQWVDWKTLPAIKLPGDMSSDHLDSPMELECVRLAANLKGLSRQMREQLLGVRKDFENQSWLVIRSAGGPLGFLERPNFGTRLETKIFLVPDLVTEKPSDEKIRRALKVIDWIKQNAEPDSWADVGGLGEIEYYPFGGELIATQRPDVNKQIEKLLMRRQAIIAERLMRSGERDR